jgi:spore coat protein U-like protein
MFPKSVLPILGIVSLQAGQMCSPGFAATHTTSVSVSATVVAGCQVSPVPFAAKGAVSDSRGWGAPISMSCSLPVPYQISVTNGARTNLAPLGSAGSNLAGPSPYARTYHLGLSEPEIRSNDSTEESNHGFVRVSSTGLLADSIGAGHGTAEDANSETITVTITY